MYLLLCHVWLSALVFVGFTHECDIHMSFMSFSLHITGLSKRRVLPKAVEEFNALNKQRL